MLSIHVENIDFSNFTEFPHAFLQLSVLAFQSRDALLGFSIEEDVLDGVRADPNARDSWLVRLFGSPLSVIRGFPRRTLLCFRCCMRCCAFASSSTNFAFRLFT